MDITSPKDFDYSGCFVSDRNALKTENTGAGSSQVVQIKPIINNLGRLDLLCGGQRALRHPHGYAAPGGVARPRQPLHGGVKG